MSGRLGRDDDAVDRLLAESASTTSSPTCAAAISTFVAGEQIRSVRAQARRSRSTTTTRRSVRSTNSRTSVEELLQHVAGLDRLAEHALRAALQAALGLIDRGDDVHRNVPQRRIVLQPLEHAPAVDVRQRDVEQDGVRLVVAGQRNRRGARAA